MANCSIPNSSPANGRILTRSSRLSKKLNKRASFQFPLVTRCASHFEKRRRVAGLQSALRAGEIQSTIGNREPRQGVAETERKAATGSGERARVASEFQSAIRRVKGAWWPSRSSKPSSSRKWRDRFDSYPLRQIIFDFRLPFVDCDGAGRVIFSIANRNSKIESPPKGGDLDVARADS
jgi:hypothetical protein